MTKGSQISVFEALKLVTKITDEEIRSCLFDIGDNKAHGIDGFNAFFFKLNCSVVGKDIISVVRGFYDRGDSISEINCATITLLPKVPSPSNITQCRPIDYYIVLYKVIS